MSYLCRRRHRVEDKVVLGGGRGRGEVEEHLLLQLLDAEAAEHLAVKVEVGGYVLQLDELEGHDLLRGGRRGVAVHKLGVPGLVAGLSCYSVSQ